MNITREQIAGAIEVVKALADAIKSLGTVANGTLYAHVMSKMSMTDYTRAIDLLIDAGLISKSSDNVLSWIG